MKEIADIQYITRDNKKLSHSDQARLMFSNGINWVQLRMKGYPQPEIIEQAQEAMRYANEFGGQLIINDSVEITQRVKAHGIHLGLKDTSVDQARTFLGNNVIIGGTANTFEDIQLQMKRGADYVGLGPYRHTLTKKNLSPVIGLNGYKKIMKQVRDQGITIPIVAVGGILMDEFAMLKQTGLHGIALSGALLEEMVKKVERLNGARVERLKGDKETGIRCE